MYPYGLIGNCQAAALIGQSGSVDWLCLPRPDSPPVFGRLLDPQGGHFAIRPAALSSARFRTRQTYLPNTNILKTRFTTDDGSEFEVTDFCPRFEQHGRMFRPAALFRIVEPKSGNPTIQVSCRPVNGWEKEPVKAVRGNSHLRFEIRGENLRLVTNMPLTYLCDETPFLLTEPLCFGLSWSFGIEDDLVQVARGFLTQTESYWRTWVKHCSIPSLFQKETIRSALALKLHCYEDTGAILAALSTSLPEQSGEKRNWDYRYCWLRDSAFVLSAFHNLGHFEEMEGFLKFLLDVAYKHEHSRDRLRPVYALDQSLPLPERDHAGWAGYAGAQPVRSNNQAADHVQNDVYGELILTLAPIYFDERFWHLRTKDHEELLKSLARSCAKNISQPDAGLWEVRNGWQPHSFSNLMCWAGIERVIRLREAGFLKDLELDLAAAKARAEQALESAVREGSLRNGPTDESFDAALLLLPVLRYPNADLSRRTVLEVAKKLRLGNGNGPPTFLYRYLRQDDFGTPQAGFLVCSFWLVQALARLGEKGLASETMRNTLQAANTLGLLSEHYLPGQSLQRGNFPQAYSHVGLINAAFAVSPPWDQVL
ncbi:MAG: glycoside hydrolase family 15 protein [Deltaproteobacteria bacterium]|nr:glycoside hydrolase family 15 protein [Deltaproteobacteria bacterium]